MSTASSRLLNGVRLSALTCVMATLVGCGMPTTKDQNAALTPPPATPLGVYDAMALGLRAGLEARLASATVGETPGQIIDNGISSIQSRRLISDPAALKADQQHRAAWAIVRDVRGAWVRAAGAQMMDVEIDGVLARAEAAKDPSLMAAVSELKILKGRMDSGRNQLASLLRLSGSKGLQLAVDPAALGDNGQVQAIQGSLENMELLALTSRSELSQQDGRSLDDLHAMREKTLESFPGIRNTLDRKSSGDEKSWNDFAENFTQGLVRIHTLPVTLKDESSKKFLRTMQEQAMTAAVLTQVHLAYNDYQTKQGAYAVAQAEAVPAPQPGLVGELAAAAAKAKSWLALAELKQAETALVGVLGADVLPADHAALTKTQLSARLSQRMEKDYAAALDQWTVYAANQTAAPESSISGIPGLQLVAYEPSLGVEIPLAQKLSARSSVGDQGVSRVDPKSFLPVSRWQVKSLLDAPITEP